jgi:hypothetical protein
MDFSYSQSIDLTTRAFLQLPLFLQLPFPIITVCNPGQDTVWARDADRTPPARTVDFALGPVAGAKPDTGGLIC